MATLEQAKTMVQTPARWVPFGRNDLQMALIVTRREVRDSFRDWRIMAPIVLLTLFFPVLMNFTAGRLLSFVSDYGAEIIATQLVPFLLLVVGFFPTSFSLVIALETFVGEKERQSLEPLLATPLTNSQLYLGKMLASVIPPLTASYIGITVYLIGLALTIEWYPTWELLVQTILITTVQGFVMVAGAVVISSQTTSIRASNLLASFIIVPMALLLQLEAVAMFWGNHGGLWWVIAGMVVGTVVLARMGIKVFNREELLGRDIDQIRLGWMGRTFWERFTGRDEGGRKPGIREWYRQTVALLPGLRAPAGVLLVAFLGAVVLGYALAQEYPFPATMQERILDATLVENLESLGDAIAILPAFIFVQNVRVVLLAALVGVFTFGVLGVLVFMVPWAFISFLVTQMALAGGDPWTFLLATIVPHGVLEFPVLLLVAAAGFRWHAVVIAPPPDRTVSEAWLRAAADFMRIFLGLILPLLLVSALVESFVTPQVVMAFYG